MSEQDNSELEHEPVITDEEIDELLKDEPEPQGDETQKVIARKDAIIRQLTARAKKAESRNFDNIKKEDKPVVDDDIKQTVQTLALAEKKRQFGYENNLSPDETDHIFRINPNPTKEILDDPFVKGGIQSIRTKKKVDDNTPNSSSRSPRFELPKKEDLTPDDKQKAFEEFMASKKR